MEEIIFYMLAVLGSSSIGYSLLRTGFPKTQGITQTNKILYGYAVGLAVIVPAIITALFFGAASFFLMMGVIFCLLFIIFIAKRISFDDIDDIPLISEEKKKTYIPKRILTVEEKEKGKYIDEQANVSINTRAVSPVKIKEQIFKEKQPNVIAELRKKTTAIENKNSKNNKEDALAKMKNFAKQINAKKMKKNDEIDEDELNSLDEGF